MVAVAYREGAAYIGTAAVIPCSGIEPSAEGVRIIGATRDGSPIVVRGGYVETSLTGILEAERWMQTENRSRTSGTGSAIG